MIKKSEKLLVLILSLLFLCAVSVVFYLRRQPDSSEAISLTATSGETAAAAFTDFRININLATEDQLTELPGIGETLASRIVEYRRLRGNYQLLEELLNVKGLTPEILNVISPYITTGGNP